MLEALIKETVNLLGDQPAVCRLKWDGYDWLPSPFNNSIPVPPNEAINDTFVKYPGVAMKVNSQDYLIIPAECTRDYDRHEQHQRQEAETQESPAFEPGMGRTGHEGEEDTTSKSCQELGAETDGTLNSTLCRPSSLLEKVHPNTSPPSLPLILFVFDIS